MSTPCESCPIGETRFGVFFFSIQIHLKGQLQNANSGGRGSRQDEASSGGPLSLDLNPPPRIIEGETAQVSNPASQPAVGQADAGLRRTGDTKPPTQGLGGDAAFGTRAGGGREVPTFPDELLKRTEIEVHVPNSTDKEGRRDTVRNGGTPPGTSMLGGGPAGQLCCRMNMWGPDSYGAE